MRKEIEKKKKEKRDNEVEEKRRSSNTDGTVNVTQRRRTGDYKVIGSTTGRQIGRDAKIYTGQGGSEESGVVAN